MRNRFGFSRGTTLSALTVATAAVALGLATPPVALAAPCPKAVVLEGPGALRDPIARRLEASGVAVGAEGVCRSVRVRLSSKSSAASGFDVHVEDRFGRTSHRTVSD